MKHLLTTAALLTSLALPVYAGGPTPSNPDAVQYIIAPADGATVSSPVTVQFGLRGMGVAPAGVEKDLTGHHHLVIDSAPFGSDNPKALSEALPADENHIHYGGGQTEAMVELAPGTHTLQLVLGDWSHTPHDTPIMSEVITITVE
jgi:hypothetical protein|tara:strand:+ start:1576 stop:2013 length:438 start_codon:yes stop_codon:yes gene_type:complete